MPQQTRVFRVFVSSTFSDMKEERMILQKEVFPKLERFCEKNGARFQGVDLRWGVNEELSLDQKTLQTCLNEIERCQTLSPKPNFLILLGDRYGWQPIPEVIPENEMKLIGDQIIEADNKEVRLIWDEEKNIEGWYRLDTNAKPPAYVLQPREKEYDEYNKWKPVEDEIRTILRDVVEQLNFNEEQKKKYFTSATHQEILKGALNLPREIKNPEEHVFVYIRKAGNMPVDSSAEGYIDLKDGKQDPYCKKQLDDLKRKLKDMLDPEKVVIKDTEPEEPDEEIKWQDKYTQLKEQSDNFKQYDAVWDGNKTRIKDPEVCARDVYKSLRRVIEGQLKDLEEIDKIDHEVKLHHRFKNRLVEHFKGRNEILETIHNYIHSPSEKRIMSMIGDSGSGKSSVMAKAISIIADNEEKVNNKPVLVYRFIGVTSSSTNIISLLRSICGQIAKGFNETLESIAGEDQKESLYEIYGLSEVLRKCLNLATAEKPIILFLDALNQLQEHDNAKSLYWLPRELSEHVRIVVSSLPELTDILNDTYQKELSFLPEDEARDILKGWMESIERSLTQEQYKEVIQSFLKTGKDRTGLAIYLKIAFEVAKHWHSYIKDFELQDDVSGLIENYFDFLEREHHEDFVKTAICYMLCGKYAGLTENEILEILVFDKEFWDKVFLAKEGGICHSDHVHELRDLEEHFKKQKGVLKTAMKIPIAVWSRLFLDLEPFLTEKDADGVPIITFFHQQFFEVLMERYQLVEEVESNP